MINCSWRLIELPAIHDRRGDLTFIEGGNQVPFDIARTFYLYNVPVDAHRGGHAHHALEQVIIALSGSFRVQLDDGSRQMDHVLRNPRQGLYIGPMVWREMDSFSQGAVALVLASEPYDENSYIRDREAFLSAVRGREE